MLRAFWPREADNEVTIAGRKDKQSLQNILECMFPEFREDMVTCAAWYIWGFSVRLISLC